MLFLFLAWNQKIKRSKNVGEQNFLQIEQKCHKGNKNVREQNLFQIEQKMLQGNNKCSGMKLDPN